jgi:hypothetical protein
MGRRSLGLPLDPVMGPLSQRSFAHIECGRGWRVIPHSPNGRHDSTQAGTCASKRNEKYERMTHIAESDSHQIFL